MFEWQISHLLRRLVYIGLVGAYLFDITACQPSSLLGSSFGLPNINATFDYVVVGGGTSGLTVAKRLAEDPNVSVAVIEAGGFYELDNGNVSQIPAFAPRNSTTAVTDIQPLVDWGFVTQPQPGLNGRQLHYAQGKTLGGSSARNYLAYHRGTKGSYQQWANAVDDPSFIFENLLPYFRKSPNFTAPNLTKLPSGDNISYDPSAFSDAGGPLHVSYSNYLQPITPFVNEAMNILGLENIPGPNSGDLIGYTRMTSTIDPSDETRSSSETSFLRVAIASSSLQIYKNTVAQRIRFDTNKKATGVQITTGGDSYVLSARKEVIVAAGTFKSPQLLMVSGIGPAVTLSRLQIPAVSKLEGVGQNVWDQPLFGPVHRVNVTTQQQLSNTAYLNQATSEFLNNQTGPLTDLGSQFFGWQKIPLKYRTSLSASALRDLSQFPADWPELELLPLASSRVPVTDEYDYMSINILGVAPLSRGNVTINSTDTNDNPLISPNWLLSSTDQEVAVQGLKVARDFALASGITVGAELIPGPSVQTDDQILEAIKSSLAPVYHPVGSCAMGRESNPEAVVDKHGRVFGVSSLRVIDASTFPLLPPGHCQATVYALAEKYADDIKNGN